MGSTSDGASNERARHQDGQGIQHFERGQSMNKKQNDETTTVAACPPWSGGLYGAVDTENET
jgi:hypothetical protein